MLKLPGDQLETPNLVDRAGWWLVPGSHAQALQWAAGHRPPGSAYGGSGSGELNGVANWDEEFDLPAVAGVLDSRAFVVTAVNAGGGRTAIRVDAEVTWLFNRSPAEVVPPAASAVTLDLRPDGDADAKPPAPVTVTEPAKVAQLKALVDGLPVFPPGSYSCPFSAGAALTLTFLTGAAGPARSGPALAVATISLDGCGGVAFTLDGRSQPGLGAVAGGLQVAARAVKAAGLNWKPASYLSPIAR